MEGKEKKHPRFIEKHASFFLFMALGIFLTYSSVHFPQSVGRYQVVAGWPLAVYRVEYRRVGEIQPTGSIQHRLIVDQNRFMWSQALVNVLLWTTLLYGTWWIFEKSNLLKFRRRSG